MKVCLKCKQSLSIDNFWKTVRNKDGLATWCKECSYTYNAGWRKKNQERVKEYHRTFNHGLSAPIGSCPICQTETQLIIDHDRSCCPKDRSCSSCRRGFICRVCNGFLGRIQDDTKALLRAIDYLTNPPGIS